MLRFNIDDIGTLSKRGRFALIFLDLLLILANELRLFVVQIPCLFRVFRQVVELSSWRFHELVTIVSQPPERGPTEVKASIVRFDVSGEIRFRIGAIE